MLPANDRPCKKQRQRVYPEPDFPIERLGLVGGKGSYPIRFKLNTAAFTRVLCEDGQRVGNSGASKVLKVDRARIVEWVRKEEQLRGKVSPNPELAKARQVHPGSKPPTANIEEALGDYVNDQPSSTATVPAKRS